MRCGLVAHDLRPGPGGGGEQHDPGEAVGGGEPDRDDRAGRVPDDREARRVDPGGGAEGRQGGPGVAGLPVEAGRQVVAARLAHPPLVEPQRRHAPGGQRRGERRGDGEPLTLHVRVAVERARAVDRAGRPARRPAAVGPRQRADEADAVVGHELEPLVHGLRRGALPVEAPQHGRQDAALAQVPELGGAVDARQDPEGARRAVLADVGDLELLARLQLVAARRS